MSDVESSGSSTETGLSPTRRNLLRGAAAGAGLAAAGGLLAACGSDSDDKGSKGC
jgi:multiple sugar transport system substrate-binding protein